MNITDSYVAKSFFCVGTTLETCFGCEYCRLLDGSPTTEYLTLPTQINENFRNIPVAVNIFYGDPLLQIDNTVNLLHALEKEQHKGPVIIITKGDFKSFPDIPFDLDLHIAFSTFGVNHEYDGGTWERFISNLEQTTKRINNYHYSIEFRPICCEINDSSSTIYTVLEIASKYGLSVGYSGLQGKPEIVKIWKEENLNLIPYPGYDFGHLKPLSEDVEEKIRFIARQLGVKIFHKTSCLISYVHELDKDYNCHYYRPNEVNCVECPMADKCLPNRFILRKNTVEIPFEYRLVYEEKHVCSLKKMGLCNYPTDDCSNIKGFVIAIEEEITAADYRMIKWLTGYAVDAKFNQNEQLSDKWRK